ncbi:MAG: hypothetical protein IKF60_01710 [Solobacterium sp.]|nr:hypothetical protein [Solobacterium sp.]MBR3347572.1 hypothetical protein [Solobacterium sp.]
MNAKTYLILGVVFLAVGITMLLMHAVSPAIAYGIIAAAAVFFWLSTRNEKNSKDE